MNRVLLDTSAYSAFMRGHADLQRAIQESDDITLTPVVLGELLAGFSKGSSLKKNRSELQAFFESPRVRMIQVDDETASRYAVILNALWSAGTPIPTNDVWIAASAMQHGLRLLTTDRHFQKVSQVLVDFFEPKGS